MDIKVSRTGDQAVVRIVGAIRIDVAHRLRNELVSATQERLSSLVVDLSAVDYIDSSGLATLLDCLRRLRKTGVKMVVDGVRTNVFELFKMARLDRVFDLRPGGGPLPEAAG